eukprot:2490982-Rhodomonas_salina.2
MQLSLSSADGSHWNVRADLGLGRRGRRCCCVRATCAGCGRGGAPCAAGAGSSPPPARTSTCSPDPGPRPAPRQPPLSTRADL